MSGIYGIEPPRIYRPLYIPRVLLTWGLNVTERFAAGAAAPAATPDVEPLPSLGPLRDRPGVSAGIGHTSRSIRTVTRATLRARIHKEGRPLS